MRRGSRIRGFPYFHRPDAAARPCAELTSSRELTILALHLFDLLPQTNKIMRSLLIAILALTAISTSVLAQAPDSLTAFGYLSQVSPSGEGRQRETEHDQVDHIIGDRRLQLRYSGDVADVCVGDQPLFMRPLPAAAGST